MKNKGAKLTPERLSIDGGQLLPDGWFQEKGNINFSLLGAEVSERTVDAYEVKFK